MTRPPFPLVWDNSMRSELVSCPQSFFRQYVEHWKPRRPSIDLHAGKCWASALEVARLAFYVKGLPSEEAQFHGLARLITDYGDFYCPDDSPKSLQRMCDAWVFYFLNFPFETDSAQPYIGPNGPMIEFSFVLPLDDGPDGIFHPETGDPILYSGRSDMVANYAGAVTIYDDKTTKQLGPKWAQSWDLRAQFTGYMWAAQHFGIPATQILVRGISILKTKFDKAQAINYREPWRIARWHGQVKRDIRRAMRMWEEGYWDYNEDDACSSYSGCMFRGVCQSANPQPWLETDFVRRRWDPTTREEIPIVEVV